MRACYTVIHNILCLTGLGLPHLCYTASILGNHCQTQLQKMSTWASSMWSYTVGRQKRREHDLTSSPLSGRVIRSVWQPTFICLQCNHQEMPGKCFNLPILIQNARTLNQASQSKYSSRFFWLGLCIGFAQHSHSLSSLKHFGIDPA